MNFLDQFLDSITMYRLVLYYLIMLIIVAVIYSVFNILAFNPISIILSTLFILAVCLTTNLVFSKVFHAPTNAESAYITALILALIIPPFRTLSDLPFLIFAPLLAMASKYILAIGKKHIFNPAAISVVLTSIGFMASATWWVGTLSMLPFELLGLLIVYKIRRFDLVFYFFLTSLITILGFSVLDGKQIFSTLKETFFYSAIFFFATVMLTEPLTTPPTKKLQSLYGAFVGFLYAPQLHIGTFYITPEIALVTGNIFSYLVSPKIKLFLYLKEKIARSSEIMDFIFIPKKAFSFTPGQYMEWTLTHKNSDSRGNRRYFTIASSPTEQNIRLGVRFSKDGSSFKKSLLKLNANSPLVATQLAGDFTLPKDMDKKLVFIAGGIGITPYRSMIKYLLDKNEKRQIIVFYSSKTTEEIVYTDVLEEARIKLGIKTVYTLTDTTLVPSKWQGKIGRLNKDMILSEAPDFKERLFYLSGPHLMVVNFEKTLLELGVTPSNIKKDFFPGFV